MHGAALSFAGNVAAAAQVGEIAECSGGRVPMRSYDEPGTVTFVFWCSFSHAFL